MINVKYIASAPGWDGGCVTLSMEAGPGQASSPTHYAMVVYTLHYTNTGKQTLFTIFKSSI